MALDCVSQAVTPPRMVRPFPATACWPDEHVNTGVEHGTSSLGSTSKTVKNLPALQGTWVHSLGQEDSPGEGHGNPLQH